MSPARHLSLSSPLTVGSVELRNRNLMASLTRNRSVPGTVPNDVNLEYYRQRAESAGLIFTEGTLITPQGTVWPNAPGIWSQEHADAWKQIIDAVHSEGGKLFCQLWHLGRIANNDMPEQKKAGVPVPGPSAVRARGGEGQFARWGLDESAGYSEPVPLADPREIVEQYRQAALFAKAAGFDGVELHSANGYLPHQFLDNTVNQRTDEWGGSVENRTRFGLECLQALIDVYGADKVGIKMNPAGGYDDVGMSLEDSVETFTYYLQEIVKKNVAYVQLTRYLTIMDPEFDGKKRGTPHDVLEIYGHIVKQSPNTKLLLNGGLNPQEANELISTGKIDAAVFGFLWIGNPDLQVRVEKGAELNFQVDPKTFYGVPPRDPRIGYTDYPKAT